MLHEFIASKRAEIIARIKTKVTGRAGASGSQLEDTPGIPIFLDQVIKILKSSKTQSEDLNSTARKHGDNLLRLGFSVGEVVHNYGDVCQAVTALALELGADITVDEFHTLNSCLDDATAQAVTEYARLREQSYQGTEKVSAFRDRLRNHADTAALSFAALKGGAGSLGGSTAEVLERSLKDITDLMDQWPTEAASP